MKKTLKANYLSFDQFRDLCRAKGETNAEDQERLAGYLHSLGIGGWRWRFGRGGRGRDKEGRPAGEYSRLQDWAVSSGIGEPS